MRGPYILGMGIFLFLCSFHYSLPVTKFQDQRDGQFYQATTIGHTKIMANNLKFNHPATDCYDQKERYCQHYGKLYDYRDFENGQSGKSPALCPSGWHVPTADEWEYLIKGMKPTITRSKDGHFQYFIKENYTRLQFGGFRSHQGQQYFNLGKEGMFMTATAEGENQFTTVSIKRQGKGYVLSFDKETDKARAVSCRCVR